MKLLQASSTHPGDAMTRPCRVVLFDRGEVEFQRHREFFPSVFGLAWVPIISEGEA